MITKWWITRAGDTINVEGTFLDAVEKHAGVFGVTSQEVAFAKSQGENGELAMFDKVCWDIEKDGQVIQPGAICIEQTADGLAILFWSESYPCYERIMAWLSSQPFLKNTSILMREISSMRGWSTTVGVLLSRPFVKNPNRRGNCPRCGGEMSWDEILDRGVCPICEEKLT